MPAAVDQCPQGHDTRTAAARDSQGHCRVCKADKARSKRVADSAALMVVRALESAGARFQTGGVPAEPADVARQLAEAYAKGYFEPVA